MSRDGQYGTAASKFTSTLTFTGSGVRWVTWNDSNRGFAEVWIDGKKEATVDQKTPGPVYKATMFTKTWPSEDRHTIRIVATTDRTTVDAFLVTAKEPPCLELPPGKPVADAQPGLVAEYAACKGNAAFFPPEGRAEASVTIQAMPVVDLQSTHWGTAPLRKHFAVRFTGILRIARAGVYAFYLSSDDGSRLLLNHTLVLEGGNSFNKVASRLRLVPGDYPIQIDFFQTSGSFHLLAGWIPAGGEPEALPPGVLFHRPVANLKKAEVASPMREALIDDWRRTTVRTAILANALAVQEDTVTATHADLAPSRNALESARQNFATAQQQVAEAERAFAAARTSTLDRNGRRQDLRQAQEREQKLLEKLNHQIGALPQD